MTQNGEPISYTLLVSRLESILTHQDRINQANASINSLNLLISLWNYTKNLQLKDAFLKGKKEINDLKTKLSATRSEMNQYAIEYEKKLQHQHDHIKIHQEMLSKLLRSQFKREFLLELSLWIVSALVLKRSNGLIQLITQRKRNRLIQCLLFLYIGLILRTKIYKYLKWML